MSQKPKTWLKHPVGASKKEPHRNDPCPCKSGLKWKRCHGRLVELDKLKTIIDTAAKQHAEQLRVLNKSVQKPSPQTGWTGPS